MSESDPLLAGVADYYTGKFSTHGRTSRGVDWNSPESQELRFEQLARLFPPPTGAGARLSVNEVGCGFGSFCGWLEKEGWKLDYHGCDISPAMVEAARESHGDRFTVGTACPEEADFTVASGIFNVKLGATTEEWEGHIFRTIHRMEEMSRRGFAFNCLTSYSDAEYMRDDLYYADPCRFFDYCKRTFSRNVALLHDYDLYEFTMLVRKES
ncbi:MAG: class I SAM-dependent methyltransferase [Verrucomicrobiae bacterium]|nr:class I SAM-dependent methyltransferase [Verrucomicrobiae bacterium]MCP5540642.1 class I SAM-dependent methyltransferase [Akkermansiaceae bacterium]